MNRVAVPFDATFEGWRHHARQLAAEHAAPDAVDWQPHGKPKSLFDADDSVPNTAPTATTPLRVPPEFLSLARSVACFRDEGRWARLYRTLFRLTHGEPHLLQITVDDDVHALIHMEKSVRRDAHKMRAFVRFREVHDPEGGSRFVAFHRPDHLVLPLVTDFFIDRFHDMRWTILTPDASVSWDGQRLSHHDGETRPVPEDAMEEFWKTYYSNIFNPARVRVRAMVKEMPTRHWNTLPEAEVISDLLRTAPQRMEEMIEKTTAAARSAGDYLPPGRGGRMTLPQLREAAATCRGCGICEQATQTVFGEGPADARLMLVGEQPGDQEDLAGRPFVGPAGQLLMEVMARVGLQRDALYVTNAVKHFKWEPDERGKRRLHKKPAWTEVTACQPWLLAELAAVKPAMVLGLGVTAGQSLLGPDFRLTPNRGRVWTDSAHAPWLLVTIHPSALLRIPDAALRAREMEGFERDLRMAAAELQRHAS